MDIRLFEAQRGRLVRIAYRMLGSRSEAEDMVQEAAIRLLQADEQAVKSAEAWLVSVVSRLCIDRLRRRKLEQASYVGPWLPEPWVDGPAAPSAQEEIERVQELSMAALLLLERLGPEERAAFVMRQALDADYSDIARWLGRSEAACRQLVHRASVRLRSEEVRFATNDPQKASMLADFVSALRAGDTARLLALLAPDAEFIGDGGGKVPAALKPLLGAELIGRFLLGVTRPYREVFDATPIAANGSPALALRLGERVVAILSVELRGGRICKLYNVANPDKIRRAVQDIEKVQRHGAFQTNTLPGL
jgi:RNA polymerase sigma-70 factor, ECF subfamily